MPKLSPLPLFFFLSLLLPLSSKNELVNFCASCPLASYAECHNKHGFMCGSNQFAGFEVEFHPNPDFWPLAYITLKAYFQYALRKGIEGNMV